MQSIYFATLMVMLSVTALARIGESESGLVQRYGEVTSREKWGSSNGLGEEERLWFEKEGVRICVVIYRGKAVSIAYKRLNGSQSFLVEELEKLQKSNAPFSTWRVDKEASTADSLQFATVDGKFGGWADHKPDASVFTEIFLYDSAYFKKAAKEHARKQKQSLDDF